MSQVQFLRNPQLIHVMKLIQQVCQQNDIDESHGLPHAVEIALHVRKALDALQNKQQLDQEEQENVILAALLHDVDDHKYFKTLDNQNAKTILNQLFLNTQRKSDILKMIDLVSFSKNGNHICPNHPIYYYFTRYADRVEAIGLVGIYRTLLYSQRIGTVFFSPNTPRPQTKQEVYTIMQGRDQAYMQRGGKSQSVIDHMFDKLLHIKLPEEISNSYLEQLYNEGHAYMVQFILQHSKTGYENAEADLLQRVNKWNSQRRNYTEVYQFLK